MFQQYRKTYAEINLPNLYDNYKNIEKRSNNKKIIPVIKANAYGHGAVQVAEYLYDKGIDYFAVSLLEEALELRELLPDIKILVMGIVEEEGLLRASEEDITITVSNFDQIEYLKKLKRNLTVHLNVDTGMNRLGCKNDETIIQAVKDLKENPKVFIQGIYTHFSTADDNKIYYDIQMRRFRQILEMIDHHFEMIHISNSSSTLKYESNIEFTTHARVGISLYGLTLDPGNDFLKNTFSLYTYISQIKTLNIGEKVGYGAVHTAKQREILGVLPIGYADGFIRQNYGGEVIINGERYPIVGRICMDQMFVRIDENIKKTDKVTLFGGKLSIDEVADRLETINYEIICQIGSRVPRQYIK